MGDAERLGHENGVRVVVRFYLAEYRQRRRMLAMAVIGLRRQSDADPERERSIRLEQRKGVLKARFQVRRAGNRPPLAEPQSGQAEGGQRHRGHVTGRYRELIGTFEVFPAGVQVAIGVQRAISG